MPKVSVEIPGEPLADLDGHVGDDGKLVNRSDAIRASIRRTLDALDRIGARHGRLATTPVAETRPRYATRDEAASGDRRENDDGTGEPTSGDADAADGTDGEEGR